MSVELVFNESTQKWEERKQPFATIEIETEEDFNRLRELVEADRDGRCVVLPKAENAAYRWLMDRFEKRD